MKNLSFIKPEREKALLLCLSSISLQPCGNLSSDWGKLSKKSDGVYFFLRVKCHSSFTKLPKLQIMNNGLAYIWLSINLFLSVNYSLQYCICVLNLIHSQRYTNYSSLIQGIHNAPNRHLSPARCAVLKPQFYTKICS